MKALQITRKQRVRVGLVGAFAASALVSTSASAAGVVSGATVANLFFGQLPNIVFVKVSPAPAGEPSCATNQSYDFTINLTNPGGNQLYATLLAAMLSGKVANLTGLGTCTNDPATEDLGSLLVAQ